MFGSATHIAKKLVTSSHLVGWVAKRASDLQHLCAQCATGASELLPVDGKPVGCPLVLPRRHASTIHVWLSPKAGWPARMMTLRSCMASACNIVPSAPAAEWIGGNKSHSPNPCWFIWCTVSKTSLGRTAFCRLPGSVKRARCASRMPPDF